MSSLGGPMPTASLQGKAALVTGGGRGIGRAISLQLVRKCITALAITYVGNKAAADETLAQCWELGAEKVVAIKADILDPAVGPKLIKDVLTGLKIEKLDIVVNNAAIIDLTLNEPFAETTFEGFTRMMQGNCFAAVSIAAAALPHLPPRHGRIINISSIASRDAPPDPLMAYGASKAALESFTRSMAAAFGQKHLATFNSISTGPTKTEAMEKAIDGGRITEAFLEMHKSNTTAEYRFGEPQDVAMIVAWLASEEARWINGACVMANGGAKHMIPVQG